MPDVFVDFGAANDGDGSAHTQAASPGGVGAFNTLEGKIYQVDSSVWVRRSSTRLELTGDLNLPDSDAKLIGWPKETDSNYASRPVAARAAWDGDSEDYAKLYSANASIQVICVTGSYAHRFHFEFNVNGVFIQASGSVSNLDLRHWKLVTNATSQSSSALLLDCSDSILQDFEIDFSNPTSNTADICRITGDRNALEGFNITGAFTSSFAEMVVLGEHCYACDFVINRPDTLNQQLSLGNIDMYSEIENLEFIGGAQAEINFTTQGNNKVRGLRSDGKTSLGVATIDGLTTKLEALGLDISSIDANQSSSIHDIIIANGTLSNLTGITTGYMDFKLYDSVVILKPTSSQTQGITAQNYWFYDNGDVRLETSSTNRNGGPDFSILAVPFTNKRIRLGTPDRETIHVDLASGVNTITMFVASKSSTLTSANIHFELEYIDSGNRLIQISSGIQSDLSTWVNDDDLTAYKLEIVTGSLAASTTGAIRLEIAADPSLISYMYIDPRPVVT